MDGQPRALEDVGEGEEKNKPKAAVAERPAVGARDQPVARPKRNPQAAARVLAGLKVLTVAFEAKTAALGTIQGERTPTPLHPPQLVGHHVGGVQV